MSTPLPNPIINFELLESVLNAFNEPFYLIRVSDFSIVLANQAARALGVNASTSQRFTCFALTHRRDSPCEGTEHPCPMKHVFRERKPFVVEHIHFAPDGSPYFAEVHGYPLYNAKGEVEFMVEHTINITERKAAEEQLRLLHRALEFSGNGVVITNDKGMIEHVNPAFSRITGYAAEEVIGQNPRLLKSGEHPPEFYTNLWETILRGEIWRGEMSNRKKDGGLYWEYQTIAPVRDTRGQITHFVATKEDITARKEAERELERLAYTDPLTGLANRRHFFHHAETFFSFSAHPSTQLAALMVDIDHFKNVNDQHGHAIGDEVLHEVAARLNRNLRPNDLIGRYGGEEFSILLPRANCETALQVAERMRTAIADEPFQTGVGALALTISVGAACLAHNTQSLDKLLQSADEALYQAKHGGRNRCVVYQTNP